MKIQPLNNNFQFIIELHEGLYLKDNPIGYTTNKNEATIYDLYSKAFEAMNRYKAHEKPVIIPPQDITAELFPDNESVTNFTSSILNPK